MKKLFLQFVVNIWRNMKRTLAALILESDVEQPWYQLDGWGQKDRHFWQMWIEKIFSVLFALNNMTTYKYDCVRANVNFDIKW